MSDEDNSYMIKKSAEEGVGAAKSVEVEAPTKDEAMEMFEEVWD